MKRKLFITTLIVGFLFAGAQTIAEEPDAHSLNGTWIGNFYWKASSADTEGNDTVEPAEPVLWYITMYTQKFGVFSDDYGTGGWVLNPSPNMVLLIYNVDCAPIYFSKNFNGVNFMSGIMWCRVGSGWGTWDATKQ